MENTECLIYWDTQDPQNHGWAYRHATGSGPVDSKADMDSLAERFILKAPEQELVEIYATLGAAKGAA